MAHEQADTIADIQHLITEDETPVDNLPSKTAASLTSCCD